ncbi:hypothetical protein ABIC03_007176 [Bradyrhizobium sp. RT6a]|uniref:hypothetical protein n=1 Tax=Bradyrhizobium sp. RT6a TaxID=3156381 RepID=UPI003399E5C5
MTIRRKKAARSNRNACAAKAPIVFIEPARMPDDVWHAISQTTKLPDNARLNICAAVGAYRSEIAATTLPLQTKRRVQKIRQKVSDLRELVEKLADDEAFYRIGIPYWHSRTGPQKAHLSDVLLAMRRLNEMMADAEDRFSSVRRGQKSPLPLERFLTWLVWIQAEATQRPLRRSTKILGDVPHERFVHACAKFADAKLAESKIDQALKRVIAQRHAILRDFGFDTATGEQGPITVRDEFLPIR